MRSVYLLVASLRRSPPFIHHTMIHKIRANRCWLSGEDSLDKTICARLHYLYHRCDNHGCELSVRGIFDDRIIYLLQPQLVKFLLPSKRRFRVIPSSDGEQVVGLKLHFKRGCPNLNPQRTSSFLHLTALSGYRHNGWYHCRSLQIHVVEKCQCWRVGKKCEFVVRGNFADIEDFVPLPLMFRL